MRRLLYMALMLVPLMQAAAQKPDVQPRWFALEHDSIRVPCALPQGSGTHSAVIVLNDRFGAHDNVQSVLKVLARLGYRAYAPPLRSTPEQSLTGVPGFTLDSSDVDIVTQVAVDVMNDADCSGRVALLAFDAGALVAMDLIHRFPFFKSAALFYPPADETALQTLLDTKTVLQLHIAQFDPDCTLASVNAVREQFMESGKTLHVFYYKDARRFFFNPEHEDYHKKNTQTAWNHVLKLLRSTL